MLVKGHFSVVTDGFLQEVDDFNVFPGDAPDGL